MEEPTRASLEEFFCPGVCDIMLSLWSLQSAIVVYFSTILRAYKLMRLLAGQQKSRKLLRKNICTVEFAYIVSLSISVAPPGGGGKLHPTFVLAVFPVRGNPLRKFFEGIPPNLPKLSSVRCCTNETSRENVLYDL